MVISSRRSGSSGSSSVDPGSELGLVHQGHQVGVGEQVAELVLDVAVVDVDPHRPELEHGPGRLHPLHAVEGVDAHMVTGPDPVVGQIVGEPVGPVLHLGVGAAVPVGHQVLPVAEGVNGGLEQISEVERRHRAVSRTRFHSGGKHRLGPGRRRHATRDSVEDVVGDRRGRKGRRRLGRTLPWGSSRRARSAPPEPSGPPRPVEPEPGQDPIGLALGDERRVASPAR